jgi:CheY-like chemotaxis protein
MPTIAWIEDDIDIIYPVVRPLERAGYQILKLHNTQEAREQLQKVLQADLILLDSIIPPDPAPTISEGLEFLKWLKQQREKLPPVLVFTVVTDPTLHQQFRDLGVADIARKPILPSALKAKVEAVLGIKSGD